MSGGAVWHDRSQFALGVWLSAINVIGVLAGPGWHSLVVAILGGGGMLLLASGPGGAAIALAVLVPVVLGATAC